MRLVVGWSASVEGGGAVAGTALHVALAKGWARSPNTMSWELSGGLSLLLMAALTLAMSLVLTGGVLLLRRTRASVPILRVGAVSVIFLSILGQAMAVHNDPVYGSYWSTPATAAYNALPIFRSLWMHVAILLLTLPPLARRMV